VQPDDTLSIYIGHDPREQSAWNVCAESIRRTCSWSYRLSPISHSWLQQWYPTRYNRPIAKVDGRWYCPVSQAPMATEFAVARFAAPLLSIDDWCLFMDCDMLVRADLKELMALRDPSKACMVVKHRYEADPKALKMDGQVQTAYPRKNWSSVCLWNTAHPSTKALSWEMLNTWPGRDLHAFKWLKDEEIGELPPEWNHLVGEYPPNPGAKIVHHTLGIPDMPGYEDCEFADEWRALKG
jgi:hypothetical protein